MIDITMPSVFKCNISEDTHRALKARAARHGRSTESEIREILEEAVRPDQRMMIGSRLAEFGRTLTRAKLDPILGQDPIEHASFD
jgi:plasmid stability protein